VGQHLVQVQIQFFDGLNPAFSESEALAFYSKGAGDAGSVGASPVPRTAARGGGSLRLVFIGDSRSSGEWSASGDLSPIRVFNIVSSTPNTRFQMLLSSKVEEYASIKSVAGKTVSFHLRVHFDQRLDLRSMEASIMVN
jgi:hypothetical protein